MARDNRQRVPFRRRREGKTDYRRRLGLLKSQKRRLVVRKSLKHTLVQIVEWDAGGDWVLASASTSQLKSLGWTGGTGNVPAAYLAGLLAGKRASKLDIKEAVLDLGLGAPSPGSRAFASLRGVLDAGVSVPHSEEVLPSRERIRGDHLKRPGLAEVFEAVRQRIMAG
ncbi:MAG: 50S ribosomal protein L18 [Thermoplasmatota archaeon]